MRRGPATGVADEPGRAGTVARTFEILEVVARAGGASARDIAEATGLPLPTVYRLLRELLDGDYLVHIKETKRFELGYKLHSLGVSLHEQIGVSAAVRAEVTALHREVGAAAYLAVHRGSQIVVVLTADSAAHPRLSPIEFGFHEAPHATAFGKILLAGMDREHQLHQLGPEPMAAVASGTITTHAEMFEQLARVAGSGIAWELNEFQDGATCAAAAVRAGNGELIGSVAVSGPEVRFRRDHETVEGALRATASRISRIFRSRRSG